MGKLLVVKKRRRREGKTNYKKRLALLKSEKPRLVVRKTNKYVIAQLVISEEAQDKVVVGVTSKVLAKFGWQNSFKNIPACYLTGIIIGKLGLSKGINEAIVDIGLHRATKGNRLFAVVKGCIDAGMQIKANAVFPDAERIKGKHINDAVQRTFEEIYEKLKQVDDVEKIIKTKSNKK